MALVATLWILAVLSILATEYLYMVHLDGRMSDNVVDRTTMEYAAKAGIAAFTRVLAEDDAAFDDASEQWAQDLEGQFEDPITAEKIYGYQVSVTDENSLIDINTASQDTISSLLSSAGVSQESQATLAQNIVSARDDRPFVTTGDLARVEGMTNDVLYGGETAEGEQSTPLINLITVHSVDKNVQSGGDERTNITDADANALRQGLTDSNGQELLSEQEAEAIIAYRDENEFQSIGDLFDPPAITQQVLDDAREQLSTDGANNTTNINTADANELANVDGFDQGSAEAVVRYRDENGNFDNVDEIREAPVFTRDEIRQVADKATVVGEDTVRGVVNLNTASAETLALLPGMNQQRAQDIVNRRQGGSGQQGGGQPQIGGAQQQETNPFTSVGDLLQIDSIDEDTFKQISSLVTYRTQVFRVEANGVDSDGTPLTRIVASLDRSADSVAIRYWRTD